MSGDRELLFQFATPKNLNAIPAPIGDAQRAQGGLIHPSPFLKAI